MRRRRHPILRALLILLGGGIGLAVALLAVVGLRSVTHGAGFGHAVGVLDVRGVIGDVTPYLDQLDEYRKDAHTVAVVLRIDSPGGAVAPSQELYDEVWRVRAEKPVIASLGNVAASGGYYVASAAHVVVADPGSLTGSIGAIMELPNWSAAADKVGVGEAVVKSGRYKDIGHPLRALTDDERLLLQGMVDDILGQFVDAVARGRGMDPARVRAIADGRIFSGAQAQSAGLVDELGGLRRAVELAWQRAGQQGEPRTVRFRPREWPRWLGFLGMLRGLVTADPDLGGGLMFLYGGSTPR